jgi:predicted MPP superfamily phosphohydrolase
VELAFVDELVMKTGGEMSGQLSRRHFLQIMLGSAITTTIAGVAGFGYAHDIEPEWVEIVPLRLSLPRLSPAFDGYRVAQISDIHMGTGMTEERLIHIAELVNAQEPDLIAITGDFVTMGSVSDVEPALVAGLSRLQARDAVLAVLGNHDHWTGAPEVSALLRKSGVIEVANRVHTIRRGGAQLHFAGVDDYWERKDRLDIVLDDLPDDGAAVLLAHEPDYADISAQCGRFDLQISGHSHGGQIRLPLIGPLDLPGLSEHYPMGQYQVGTMIQYTNRGVGTVYPPVRFNCRPEITVLTLEAHKI